MKNLIPIALLMLQPFAAVAAEAENSFEFEFVNLQGEEIRLSCERACDCFDSIHGNICRPCCEPIRSDEIPLSCCIINGKKFCGRRCDS